MSTLDAFGMSTGAVHDRERRHQTSDAMTTPEPGRFDPTASSQESVAG